MRKRASRCNTTCAVLAAFVLSSPAWTKEADPMLGMEHFRDSATVVDLPQNTAVTISTEKGYVEKHGPLHSVWNDEYLVASIDRKSGQRTFQVVVWLTYAGRERLYQNVSFDTPHGKKTVNATRLSSKKEYCTDEDCTFTERLSFPVEADLLQQLAARAGSSGLWSFTVTGKSGTAYTGSLSYAEAAGLLAKADGLNTSTPPASVAATPAASAAPNVPPAPAPRAALKVSLGIEGLSVEGDSEHPKRSGILITAVARDGIAHRSNLIVGDILYELNGQPVRTAADLERAAASCAPNSTVTVRLYRGLADTQLSAKF